MDEVKIVIIFKEVELMWFLVNNLGVVFIRERLLDKIWGYDYLGDLCIVDIYVKCLCRKIEKG